MIMRGYNDVAVMYIHNLCNGVPAYIFASNLVYVGKNNFMLPDTFYEMWEDVRTVDDIYWLIDYWSALFTHKDLWI